MPAPKNPNTAAATAAVKRRGQETMAAKLRAAGWVVIAPEKAAEYRGQEHQGRPPRSPADYVPYGERRPVTLPDSLDQLVGPTTGTIDLPIHLDWSGKPSYNLDSARRTETLYATVLAEAADPDDLGRYLNRDRLIALWPTMWLPPKIRRLWEQRFPQLAATRHTPDKAAV
jgi:hypothetical protein